MYIDDNFFKLYVIIFRYIGSSQIQKDFNKRRSDNQHTYAYIL